MNISVRRLARVFASFAIAASLAGEALAQVWPAKPLRFIVPYAAGGGADLMARIIAPKLAESLGQVVVVDNKPGASTIIGTEILVKSPPDGYTIALITDAHSINPSFNRQLPYDSLKDIEPVSQLMVMPFMLVANPALQVKSVKELVTAARARPGRINFASVGTGSPHYLAMEWLKSIAGVDLTHVPYKGVAPALADIVGGQVEVMFTGMSSALPQVKGGKLLGLAVTSNQRQSTAPGVPTVAESGLPDADLAWYAWYGVAAPGGTPKDIVNRLNREIARALALPDVRERLASLGIDPAPSSPEQFAAFIAKDIANYARVVKMTGAKGE